MRGRGQEGRREERMRRGEGQERWRGAGQVRRGAKSSEEQGRPENTYHVNDIKWMLGGRGPHINNILDFIIGCSVTRQDLRRSQDCEYHIWPVRNSLSGLLGTLPPTPSRHIMS